MGKKTKQLQCSKIETDLQLKRTIELTQPKHNCKKLLPAKSPTTNA
jgi:hypothetical protein